MLSRTADNLYWLARYVERAEYLARILDTTLRLTALPLAYVGTANEWESAVATAGCANAFFAHLQRGQRGDRHRVSRLLDRTIRPRSAIASRPRAHQCALGAHRADHRNVGRHQRRLARTQALGQRPDARARNSRASCAGCRKRRCASTARPTAPCCATTPIGSRGSASIIERADNTARILDVKYHMLLPAHEQVGGPLDYFQWAAILRSVSALTAYHWVYRENVKPWLVADLLMLKDEMPRSLASCYENLVQNLDRIATAYGRQGPAQRQARTIRARLAEQPHRGDLPDRPARIHRRFRRGQQSARHRDRAAISDVGGATAIKAT